jgi:hypothetical protein
MGRSGSVVHQVKSRIDAKFRPGLSRHEVKRELGTKGTATPFVHSYRTRETYISQGMAFAKWARDEHGCRTLADAEHHVNGYIGMMRERGDSPYSQKTAVAAIAKVYGKSSRDYAPTDARSRANIERSRGPKASDKHFSEASNAGFVNFARTVGLRRMEYAGLRRDDVRTGADGRTFTANHLARREDGRYVLRDVRGKGGKYRDVLLVGPHIAETVARIEATRQGELIWHSVPTRADIHGYRADYANSLYREAARDPATIPYGERYFCRNDRAGVVFDREAMRVVSQSLGHERIGIIAASYLWR